jgi:hypothetical protein
VLYLKELSDLILLIKFTKSALFTSLFGAILTKTFLAIDKKSLLNRPNDADCFKSEIHPSSSLTLHLEDIEFKILKSSLSSDFKGS